MTTTAGAKRWIVAALALTAATSAFSEVSAGNVPPLRIAIGAAFAAVLLTLLAEVAPEVAALLATIVLVGALLSRGSLLVRFSDLLEGK